MTLLEKSQNLDEMMAQEELEERASRLLDPEWEEISPEDFPKFYQESKYLDRLMFQSQDKHREVLISDIDRTFFHEDMAIETQALFDVLERASIPVCYNTGRGIEQVVAQEGLPHPDIIMPAVGTEIWIKQKDGSIVLDENYRDLLRKNWDREIMREKLSEVIEKNEGIIDFQERDRQRNQEALVQEFKISLNLIGDEKRAERMESELVDLLGDNVGIIISTNWRQENTFYVDILPKLNGKTGKAMPIQYLKNLADFRSIVAGDGGNDAEMIFGSGSQGIVVGNSLPEMRAILNNLPNRESNWRPKLTSYEVEGQRNDIYVADQNEIGPRALFNAMTRGDFNPFFARKILQSI